MPDLTREELEGLIHSSTWQKVIDALEKQKSALMERLCFGLIQNTIEETAMKYMEASTEIRMYDEFIHLDELLFERKENDEQDSD